MFCTRKVIIWTLVIVCSVLTVVVPLIYLVGNTLRGEQINVGLMIYNVAFTFLAAASITAANLFTFQFFERKYSGHKGYLKIFALELLITSVNAAIIISIIVSMFYMLFGEYAKYENEQPASVYYQNIVVAVIINIIVSGLAEAYIIFRRWKQTVIETERLKREKAESQYAALRNQVNPHFLFNSLNSLSSLIRVSPEKAIDFVDKFSKIYRYVLDVNSKSLVELKLELDFLKSFFFLQQIRFGENVNLNVSIPDSYLSSYLPPLSLQLIIENAIKHNEVSVENPLFITIVVENDFLIVKNNLQLKNTLEESTGIGLNNLKQRYEHFTDSMPEFYCTENEYIAKIPLIIESE